MIYKLITIAPEKLNLSKWNQVWFTSHLPTGSITESSLGLISPSIALEPNEMNNLYRMLQKYCDILYFAYVSTYVNDITLMFFLKDAP
jgi:hypothetical protein